ncbi:non-heme chloroperoxidase [Blastococcus colisei]|uniref:Non-heme chloroperoxidase n=1 Tax=Blastococcus colisei TaxID=1564162 RepID=A0A543PG68_9ACTN|nr:alpha/beta hydrolase [Blastococcus colisei]TQN43082.1 non-heme chloroperoxidase [Blastococcus colisei]
MTDVTSFDGTRLALSSWGPPDAPPLLLVHGLGLSTESWGAVPERLADRYRVTAYDLRGHAQSGDARSGGYTMTAHARDLGAVLDEVVPDGARVVVVGHSLGGGILLTHLDAEADDRIAGAVLVGSGASGVTAPGLPARNLPRWARLRLRSGWWTLLRSAVRIGRRIKSVQPVSDRLIRRAAFAPGEPQELVARVRDSFFGSRPLALAGTTMASLSHDGVQLAPAMRVPTLVVHGSRDPEVPGEEVEELMSVLPDGELFTIPDAGHMLPLTHPDVVVAQVRRWMDRLTTGTGRP